MTGQKKTTAEVLASTKEMLAMARAGLADATNSDPTRRRPGLMNLITYGRSVTFTLQNLKNVEPGFTEWYEPLQTKMVNDPLMKFFSEARNAVLKEGKLAVGAAHSVWQGRRARLRQADDGIEQVRAA